MMCRSSRRTKSWSLDGRAATLLPFCGRVVFVDWNGVLNNELFWSSILERGHHPLSKPLKRAVESVFGDREKVRAWMRGWLNSEEVIQQLAVDLDRRFRDDFLLRRLNLDCRRMVCEPRLVHELREAHAGTFVVLATDNMDCFWQAVLGIKDLSSTVDAILCSSELGVLKKDSIEHFFGPWLDRHALAFQDALLLDDSRETCDAFRAVGGSAIVVQGVDDAIQGLRSWRRAAHLGELQPSL